MIKEKQDFLIILIGKLLQVVIMLITIRVSTSLLNPIEMGNIYLFITIYTFFVLTFISPVGQYINRYTHAWHENKTLLEKFYLYVIYLIFIALSATMISYVLYRFNILNGIGLDVYLVLIFGFVLSLTLNQTLLPFLNMLYYRISFTSLTVLTSLATLVFGYFFINYFGESASSWLFGILVANIIVALMGFYILKNNLKEARVNIFDSIKKITKNNLKNILKFTFPLAIATLFMWLQNSGYRIIIEKNIGLEFLGFFGVGMAVSSQIASVVESIVMQYFYPIYYKEITNTSNKQRKKSINILINKVLPIYFMLAIFLTFLSKYILELLVDEKYYLAYIYVSFGIWVELFRMSTNLLGNIAQSELNTKPFMYPYIVGSIMTSILVFFISLGSEYRFYLPMALILGGLITYVMMFYVMRKLIDFSINYKLLLIAFIISIPYASVYFIDIDTNIYYSFFIVLIFGLYFLGTMFYIYKKGLVYDYS